MEVRCESVGSYRLKNSNNYNISKYTFYHTDLVPKRKKIRCFKCGLCNSNVEDYKFITTHFRKEHFKYCVDNKLVRSYSKDNNEEIHQFSTPKIEDAGLVKYFIKNTFSDVEKELDIDLNKYKISFSGLKGYIEFICPSNFVGYEKRSFYYGSMGFDYTKIHNFMEKHNTFKRLYEYLDKNENGLFQTMEEFEGSIDKVYKKYIGEKKEE